MNKILYLSIVLIVCLSCPVKSQNYSYDEFIADMMEKYNKQEKKFKIISENALMRGIELNRIDNVTPDSINYIIIPQILLSESRKYSKAKHDLIDSVNITKYFDPKSMFYYEALIIKDDFIIGTIFPYDNEKYLAARLHKHSKLDIELSEYYVKNQPDLIFTVINQNSYFVIKNNDISVLLSVDYSLKEYSLIEYIENYKDMIFDWFWYVEKRVAFPYIGY